MEKRIKKETHRKPKLLLKKLKVNTKIKKIIFLRQIFFNNFFSCIITAIVIIRRTGWSTARAAQYNISLLAKVYKDF